MKLVRENVLVQCVKRNNEKDKFSLCEQFDHDRELA